MALWAGQRFIGCIYRTVDDIRLTTHSATELISRHTEFDEAITCGSLATARSTRAPESKSRYLHRMQVLLTRRRHVDNMRVASSFCR